MARILNAPVMLEWFRCSIMPRRVCVVHCSAAQVPHHPARFMDPQHQIRLVVGECEELIEPVEFLDLSLANTKVASLHICKCVCWQRTRIVNNGDLHTSRK